MLQYYYKYTTVNASFDWQQKGFAFAVSEVGCPAARSAPQQTHT
jgi:hypothetical protein